MSRNRIIITGILFFINLAVIVLAYMLGYQKAEDDLYESPIIFENHIKAILDPSNLSDEDKMKLKKLQLELEESTKELPY